MKKSLSDRMKEYEKAYDFIIPRHLPIAIRIDGKKFSSLMKKIKVKKPFDADFSNIMINTSLKLVSEIDGCVIGYTQSDEISLILRNDFSLETEPYLGNRLQKMCSVITSIATSEFVKNIKSDFNTFFDCRLHILPNIEEVLNYLIWRQQDAVRNSILNSTYHEISKLPDMGRKKARKLMYELNTKQLQDLLFEKTGINWNNYSSDFKRGILIYKKEIVRNDVLRKSWTRHDDCPIFQKEDNREFIKNIIGN